MIGGEDIIIPLARSTSVALPAAVRYVLGRWPSAVVQDGDTAQRLRRLADLELAHLRELFIYRDEPAFHSWARLGANPANANQMIHLVAEPGRLTVVVDDRRDGAIASIVDGLQRILSTDPPSLVPSK